MCSRESALPSISQSDAVWGNMRRPPQLVGASVFIVLLISMEVVRAVEIRTV